jgi:protein-disulfide isomerase
MQDITEGIKAGINGTPAVYLNGMPMAPELDGQKLGGLLKLLSDQMK